MISSISCTASSTCPPTAGSMRRTCKCKRNCHEYRIRRIPRAFGQLYDSVEPWPIEFEKGGWEPGEGVAEVDWFRLGTRPMRHPRQGKAKEHYACAVQRLHHGQGHPR